MFILTKNSLAEMHNYPVLGIISSLVMGHNGAARTFASPNVAAQVALARRALSEACIEAKDVKILEGLSIMRLFSESNITICNSSWDGDTTWRRNGAGGHTYGTRVVAECG